MPWERNTFLFHRGHMIEPVEENGRRFWSVNLRPHDAWSIPQEFCTTGDAARYIDREVTKH
jgi:hypothetical protein